MEDIQIIVEDTQATGELYLDIDGVTHLIYFDQDRANKGEILVVPEFEDEGEEESLPTPIFPRYTNNEDVFIYWYTFYYLMSGKSAPLKVEKHYLSLS